MPDSITNASDTDLVTIATQVVATLTAAPTTYGLVALDASNLDTALANFQSAITTQAAAIATARSTTEDKNAKRVELETQLRRVRSVAKSHDTPAAAMATLGIPPPSPTPPPTATVPLALIDTRERMKHTINWTDAGTPGSKRRPRGTIGVEIFVKVGDPAPGNEADCVFLALDTVTPYVASFTPADSNKNAYYMLRWRMQDGSVSAWGETVSATITA